MKKRVGLFLSALLVSIVTQAAQVPAAFTSIDKRYSLKCEGEQFEGMYNILAIKAFPEQNKLVVLHSEYTKKSGYEKNMNMNNTLELANQKVLVSESRSDDMFGGKNRTYTETQYSSTSIKYETTARGFFKKAVEFGLYVHFDDENLNSGKLVISSYWAPKNIETHCTFSVR